MRENADQKNSEYGHFSRSVQSKRNILNKIAIQNLLEIIKFTKDYRKIWNVFENSKVSQRAISNWFEKHENRF